MQPVTPRGKPAPHTDPPAAVIVNPTVPPDGPGDPPAPASRQSRAPTWRYSHRAGWHEGHHPLPPTGAKETGLHEWLASGGFALIDEIDPPHAFLGVSVYERESAGDWFVSVDFPCITRLVYCPDMPSMLKLMGELLPVVEAAHRLGGAAEEHNERMKRRRRGPIYDAARRRMESP